MALDGRRGDSSGRRSSRRSPTPKPTRAEKSDWGSVAKHGAAGATHGQRLDESEPARTFSPDEQKRYAERQARRSAKEARMAGLRGEARAAIERSARPDDAPGPAVGKPTVARRPLPTRPPVPPDIERELRRSRGPDDGRRAHKRFLRGAREFQREQFTEARKTLRPLVEESPEVSELHELYGLTLYRLGEWAEAVEHLEAFRRLAGTAEQHPPLMDAHRALGNWADVEELWGELGDASPNAELMVEGRIVRAGAEADRGALDSAIRILERGWKPPKQPREHHLRRAYALADLYDRAGRIPRGRSLFQWLDSVAPGYLDVGERARKMA